MKLRLPRSTEWKTFAGLGVLVDLTLRLTFESDSLKHHLPPPERFPWPLLQPLPYSIYAGADNLDINCDDELSHDRTFRWPP